MAAEDAAAGLLAAVTLAPRQQAGAQLPAAVPRRAADTANRQVVTSQDIS